MAHFELDMIISCQLSPEAESERIDEARRPSPELVRHPRHPKSLPRQ